MQFLFSLSRDKELDFEEASKRYWNSIEIVFDLYLYNLYVLIGISDCAVEDNKNRKTKYLPTDYDKDFTDKLSTNCHMAFLRDSEVLQKLFQKRNFASLSNPDYYKKIYAPFSKSEDYKKYIATPSTKEGDLLILLELYRHCRKDELFNELMEDTYPQWIDDKSIVVGTVKKTLKEIPSEDVNFFQKYYPDDETVKDYGFMLLKSTYEDDEKLLEFIKPTLKNWDHERVAIIDMILLKMAIVEFLNFPTIPTTVTINEFVEVSKSYSTAKSKDFINGILDRLKKDFEEKDMIQKTKSKKESK